MKLRSKLILPLLMASALSLSALYAVSADAPVTSAAPAVQVDAFVIKFDSAVNMMKNKTGMTVSSDGHSQGNYKIVTKDDPDAPYIKLLYETKETSYAPYRCAPGSSEAGVIPANYKFVRVTYKTTDDSAASIQVRASKNVTVLVPNTKVSSGEWTVSPPVAVNDAIMQYFANKKLALLEYTATQKDADMCIKELAFFKSAEDAYTYYGESPSDVSATLTYPVLTYTPGGTGTFHKGENYGLYSVNAATDAVDIVYAESTNFKNVNYMAKLKFASAADYDTSSKYLRVYYSAKNPAGAENVKLLMKNDGYSKDILTLVDGVKDTDGFVLTETFEMLGSYSERFAKPGHFSFYTDCTLAGGTYSIKAVYFFPTKEAADSFTVEEKNHVITIGGNDISKYQIVVPENSPLSTMAAASNIVNYIKSLSGIILPIVDETSPESEYEILVGRSSRVKSQTYIDELTAGGADVKLFCGELNGNTPVISSVVPAALEAASERFLMTYLYKGIAGVPDTIELNESIRFSGETNTLYPYTVFDVAPNVAEPTVFAEDFDADEGYFAEENGADDWKYEKGSYVTRVSGRSLSYVHVYEANVSETATFTYKSAGQRGDMGLTLRYTAEDAYLRAGYDFKNGEWYIDCREGTDFYRYRLASVKATVTPNTVYTLNFTADARNASLSVNGQTLLSTSVPHITPGKIGIYAEDIELFVDSYEAVLLSGQGTIFRYVEHTKLPDEEYREGGSVLTMNDGSWIYQNHKGVAFKSINNGKTWERTELWVTNYGPMNVLRLENGDFLQIATQTIDNVKYRISRTSSDEGKTWVDGGIICPVTHPEYNVNGSNMNDKVMQSGTSGRIFYGQNYQADNAVGNGMIVFCEYYYSDDNGKTWQSSETSSYTIEGNEDTVYFGENKLLQCADGIVRVYCSWNRMGNIMYSESVDGGVTFGPLKKAEGLVSAQSSMQFVRDPYGPTDTSYYLLWLYCEPNPDSTAAVRSRLCLAYSTDGMSWEYIGDIWRWECAWTKSSNGIAISHMVDPFINVTKDYIICGTGVSEKAGDTYHNEQRQHIWTIRRDTLPESRKLNVFTDVSPAAGYYDAVTYVSENGLFNGTSENTFSPDMSMTRSMFVTVLGRLDGADVAKYTTPTFADVAAGQWYTSYVEWAAANGVVNGIGNGLYGINDNVTVEQVCVMLSRYASDKKPVAGALAAPSLSDFADSASVSSWATDAVKWAVENGVYSGIAGKLNPTSPASRALVATMFYNYVSLFGK